MTEQLEQRATPQPRGEKFFNRMTEVTAKLFVHAHPDAAKLQAQNAGAIPRSTTRQGQMLDTMRGNFDVSFGQLRPDRMLAGFASTAMTIGYAAHNAIRQRGKTTKENVLPQAIVDAATAKHNVGKL